VSFIHETAILDSNVELGEGVFIWHFSHILSDSKIGNKCNLGQNVMIGPKVAIGEGCKIQNNVSIYEGVELGKNVFCGPSCVFTNVTNPRAFINRKKEYKKTIVGDGVTLGANCTILCGITIGKYAFIGAGAVVTKNIKDFALVIGNPARQVGWVSETGAKLDNNLVCPETNTKYILKKNKLIKYK